MRVCKKCKRERNRNAFLGQKQTCAECLRKPKEKKERKYRTGYTMSPERIEKNRLGWEEWYKQNHIIEHIHVFGMYCEESEKRMLLNDTVICDHCGCEVWFEDGHMVWEAEDIGFGWVTRWGKTSFKVNSYGQEHYLPSRKKRHYSIMCSFCRFQKKIKEGGPSRYARDVERAKILRWLGIHDIANKMNKADVNELINLKRIEIQTKRELKKIKQ